MSRECILCQAICALFFTLFCNSHGIGDFGLVKSYYQGIDPQTSRVAGTLGYIAPEFLRTGRATKLTEVYAFGLVMLEVVCGKRLIKQRAAENEEVIVDWILELWENGKIFDATEESIRQEQNREKLSWF